MNTRLKHRPIPKRSTRPATATASAPVASLFALILTGTALSPRYRHGDCLAIDTRRQPRPGDAVLATLDAAPGKSGKTETRCVMFLNADRDLTDNRGAWVPRGSYTVRGVVVGSDPAREV